MSASPSRLRPFVHLLPVSSETYSVWMKANQMPTVESQLCDGGDAQKSPRCGQSVSRMDRTKKPRRAGRVFPRYRKKSADFGHISGLGSFLSLHDFEFDFIALGE